MRRLRPTLNMLRVMGRHASSVGSHGERYAVEPGSLADASPPRSRGGASEAILRAACYRKPKKATVRLLAVKCGRSAPAGSQG